MCWVNPIHIYGPGKLLHLPLCHLKCVSGWEQQRGVKAMEGGGICEIKSCRAKDGPTWVRGRDKNGRIHLNVSVCVCVGLLMRPNVHVHRQMWRISIQQANWNPEWLHFSVLYANVNERHARRREKIWNVKWTWFLFIYCFIDFGLNSHPEWNLGVTWWLQFVVIKHGIAEMWKVHEASCLHGDAWYGLTSIDVISSRVAY